MTAVFYELEADRVEVDAVQAEQPWDSGRVRLTLWHRNDNGIFTDHVFDVSGESARDLAACLEENRDTLSTSRSPAALLDLVVLLLRLNNRMET